MVDGKIVYISADFGHKKIDENQISEIIDPRIPPIPGQIFKSYPPTTI